MTEVPPLTLIAVGPSASAVAMQFLRSKARHRGKNVSQNLDHVKKRYLRGLGKTSGCFEVRETANRWP